MKPNIQADYLLVITLNYISLMEIKHRAIMIKIMLSQSEYELFPSSCNVLEELTKCQASLHSELF